MSAYAVIETGGKQYKVSEGDVLTVERLEAEVGGELTIDKVLALSGDAGLALGGDLAAAVVKAEVMEHFRGPKLIAFKKKRRKGYKRRMGHRQELTKIKIKALA
ncbi:MAG: 50S ribosomal protein L21 [Verrucomicrobia bacterium]|nr:50S ribosomal protein L21 [Verrucomicrobiota bacterium]MCH8526112.1 50S ribosomal protein L21 [Kiritimatiellia bacterium]